MSKKMLKRSLALGALMAFVITGQAWAASVVENTGNETIDKISEYQPNAKVSYGICSYNGDTAEYKGFQKITVDLKAEKNYEREIYGVLARSDGGAVGGKVTFNGLDNSVIDVDVTGNNMVSGLAAMGVLGGDGASKVAGGKITVNASKLNIKTYSNDYWAYGISVNNRTDTGTPVAPAEIVINADDTYIEVDSAVGKTGGLSVMSQGNLDINGNLTVIASNGEGNVIVTRGGATTTINKEGNSTVKLYGNIDFAYNAATSGSPVNANLNVKLSGSESVWVGNTSVTWDVNDSNKSPTVNDLEVKSFNLTIEDGATWTPKAINEIGEYNADEGGASATKYGVRYTSLNKLTLDDGIVNIDSAKMNGQQLKIDNASGVGTFTVNDANPNQVAILESDADITVQGSEELADAISNGAVTLQQVANTVTDGEKSVADTVTTKEGMVGGVVTAQVDENGQIVESTITEEVNSKSDAVSDAGMVLKGHWRAHMNDMNKRMGELRNANGEHGVWTRMVRGESEYQGAKMQYNQYQLGYDEKLSTDKRWTVGAAVTFSEGDSSYGSGSTDDKSTAFAIYGSKLNDDGTFVDLIARYAKLESDIDDRNYGTGDYDANGYSVSAEFGKRIQQGNGLWIEPQVELTYGSVDSADVTMKNEAQTFKAHYDSMDSFIARAGFALGKDIKQGNVYARASYLYDFDGETETQFVGGKAIKEDFGGGWWEVGVGANINLSKATYIYADIEKTFGGEVDTNWQWNLGVRYSF